MNLADLSIRRPVFATILIGALVVFGLLSYPRISTQLFPDIEFPVVTVTVAYPGADPETLERKVADKLEEQINTLGGVRALRSMSAEGAVQIIVEFELEVPVDRAVQDVRDRVARIAGDLPEGAEPPIVEKFDMGAEPVMTIALAGNLEPRALTELADNVVKAKLQGIEGVGAVELVGGREREVQVLVEPDRLAGFGLTVQDVGQAIASQNLEVPAGKYNANREELSVKTRGEVRSAEDIGAIFIPGARGQVRIRDVAAVVDGTQEPSSASYLDGEPAVSLVVRKQSGANMVEVAEALHREMSSLRPRLERAGATYTVPMDSSVYVKRSMHDVQVDLVLGAVLAVVVIFLFLLDPRATLISALAIPTSVISTFAFVAMMGFTFNNMTLLALSLAIGILVDDAIVVMENIHRHLRQGKPALQAASDATREIFLAVLAMTSTILAVFVPVALMKGIVGRFFLEFGLTVGFSVAVSMLVSFTLTPMMSSRMLRVHEGERGRFGRAVDAVLSFTEARYGRLIRWVLAHRAVTALTAVATLAGSVVLVSQVPMEFLPEEDRSEFQVNVELPHGATLETTSHVSEAIAQDLRSHAPGVTHTVTTVAGGLQGQSNKAHVLVKLIAPKSRKFRQQELMSWVRARYAASTVAMITVENPGGFGGGSTRPIQLNLRGNDMDELVRTAEAVKAELAQLPGFVDLDTSYRGGKPEVFIQVDRERAAELGVPVATAAATLRALLAGDPVGEMSQDGNAYDIRVRLPVHERSRVETLSNLKVRSTRGALVDLSNLVRSERGVGPSRIDRESRQRQVTVLAGLDGIALGDAQKIVDEVAGRVVPGHLTTAYAGDAQIMDESFGHMVSALLLAVVLVYMILAVQFDSFLQPLTIMISLPLSLVGAFGALALTGMTLSIFSMIGIIMLMGLVTKNAILLVDFTNQLRAQGKSVHDALIQAGVLRLRPILMTALSMIFGMLPVALAFSEGGEVRAPMAVCVIGGMITSTILTLAVVPVVYSLMARVPGPGLLTRLRRVFRRASTTPAAESC